MFFYRFLPFYIIFYYIFVPYLSRSIASIITVSFLLFQKGPLTIDTSSIPFFQSPNFFTFSALLVVATIVLLRGFIKNQNPLNTLGLLMVLITIIFLLIRTLGWEYGATAILMIVIIWWARSKGRKEYYGRIVWVWLIIVGMLAIYNWNPHLLNFNNTKTDTTETTINYGDLKYSSWKGTFDGNEATFFINRTLAEEIEAEINVKYKELINEVLIGKVIDIQQKIFRFDDVYSNNGKLDGFYLCNFNDDLTEFWGEYQNYKTKKQVKFNFQKSIISQRTELIFNTSDFILTGTAKKQTFKGKEFASYINPQSCLRFTVNSYNHHSVILRIMYKSEESGGAKLYANDDIIKIDLPSTKREWGTIDVQVNFRKGANRIDLNGGYKGVFAPDIAEIKIISNEYIAKQISIPQSQKDKIANTSPSTKNDMVAVVINGVQWATCNIAAPGTFANNPEDIGMYYQWNKKVGWNTTDPMKNSNGYSKWDKSISSSKVWEQSNDPSPSGWRIPTSDEMETLLNISKVTNVWTSVNGIYGMKFTDKTTGNSIFLPAAGWRYHSAGELGGVGELGRYSSSTQDNSNREWFLVLGFDNSSAAHMQLDWRHVGFPIRCVATK